MAANDKFGLSIKLLNGNIAGRVLPIRIHEIDAEDLKMLETELKGKLRPIDFIFKSPGVNRPLRANEDDPLKNSYHTLYRDQINKTANAVKDIINGFKNFESTDEMAKPKFAPSLPGVKGTLKSIVVLPFVNVGNQEEGFLGEGLAEDLLNSLSQVKGLKIASRASAFRLGGTTVSYPDVAEKLGAGKVIEGNAHNKDGQLILSIKISNTQNGSTIWSEHYERNLNNISGLMREIAFIIVEKLGVTLREGERNLIGKRPTENGEAYLHYLNGRFHWYREGEGLRKSLTYFQRAIGLDPDFSLAFAGMANAYVLLGYYQLTPLSEAMKKSKEAAMRALQIDPSNTDAWSALAFINMAYEWNWPEAEHDFSQVFAVNPAHPSAREKYKRYLSQINANLEEAEKEPLTTVPVFLQAYAFLHRGKFEEALRAATIAVKNDSKSFMSQRALGLSCMGLEKYNEATDALQKAASLSNRHSWLLFELMGALMLAGKIEEAQAIMEEALAEANALPSMIHNFFFPSK